MRVFGQHKSRPASDHQKAVYKLDAAVSKMVREQPGLCITCDSEHQSYDCGHFRRRELMATRFHPWNIHKQGKKENRFEGGRMYEYGIAIDKLHGKGTAQFLYKLSQKIEPWTITELEQLTSAARMGYPVYCQLYFTLRPAHKR